MKKLLISALASLASICCLGAVGCNNSSPTAKVGEFVVTFTAGEGFSYFDADDTLLPAQTEKLPRGEKFSFFVDLGAFYTGEPIVYGNNKPLKANADGSYTLTLTQDCTVRVEGVESDVSDMAGTGTATDPYLITRPVDLLYIAEQVNTGDSAYTHASYLLTCDLDCKGEPLQVIGNGSTPNAFFAGNFTAATQGNNTDSRFAISDFVINSDNSSFVGLFGRVLSDGTENSGAFNGMRLRNFTVNASVVSADTDTPLYAGSLVGFGDGVQLRDCAVENGKLYAYADNESFGYAGGLAGRLENGSSIDNAVVEAEIVCLQGTALYAGGVVGYATGAVLADPASTLVTTLTDCAWTGNILGGMRAGGIAGETVYATINNCSSSGSVNARAVQKTLDSPYRHAYAGGIVGYAANTDIENTSFTGETTAHAVSGEFYQHVHPQTGNAE